MKCRPALSLSPWVVDVLQLVKPKLQMIGNGELFLPKKTPKVFSYVFFLDGHADEENVEERR